MSCEGNQKTWNTMLSDLRNDFNKYILVRMSNLRQIMVKYILYLESGKTH